MGNSNSEDIKQMEIEVEKLRAQIEAVEVMVREKMDQEDMKRYLAKLRQTLNQSENKLNRLRGW